MLEQGGSEGTRWPREGEKGDRGSPPAGALIRVRSQERIALGAARNLAAKRSRGEYLLFMDDDNVAKPNEVTALVTAARATGASILAPANDYLHGSRPPRKGQSSRGRWAPMGASLAVGFFKDCFGDSNSLVKRSALLELGGFASQFESGHQDSTGEDWEFFAAAVMSGHRLLAVPFSLFWYRLSPGSLVHSTSQHLYRERTLRPFLAFAPPALEPVLRTTRATYFDIQRESVRQRSREKEVGDTQDVMKAVVCKETVSGSHLDGLNEVANAHFDIDVDGKASGWEPFGEGFGVERTKDSNFLTLQSPDGESVFGAQQKVWIRQAQPEPLLVAARSRARSMFPRGQWEGYTLYLDVEHTDGSSSYGYQVVFPGNPVW
eukprot:CAMPEP_0196593820 /NCGR_PEP_ID=MMETSP1081-20130531/76657_1 /TAXON_ID=36882 /ORGANISM="Pyramimonas amylifera, Strain CCMP720" /LENGTH=376 /DNA_ID=CAMNT_0041917915 /DNA_START=48 /DNA_END=1175 /DNA_ORIENTATION=-